MQFLTDWPLWAMVLFGLFVVIMALAIGMRIYGAACCRREIQFLKASLGGGDDEEHETNRVSIYNLFWDLGADQDALETIRGLDILNWKTQEIHQENVNKLKALIQRAGGYHAFVQILLRTREMEGMNEAMASLPTPDHRLEQLSTQLMSIRSTVLQNLGVQPKEVGGRIMAAFAYAIGDMSGIPVREVSMLTNVPKLKNMAMIYYRVNRQSGNAEQAVFRTIEEFATTVGAGVVGGVVGSAGGYAVAQAGISGGFFDFLDLDGDGIGGVEGFVITLAVMSIGAVLSGKLFKNVAHWWNMRRLRQLQEEYDARCTELFNWTVTDELVMEKIDSNISVFIEYWNNRLANLSSYYQQSEQKLDALEKSLLSASADEILAIIKSHQQQQQIFVDSLKNLAGKNKHADAGRLLLFHRDIVFRDLDIQASPYFNAIKNALESLKAEVLALKAKGKLPGAAM